MNKTEIRAKMGYHLYMEILIENIKSKWDKVLICIWLTTSKASLCNNYSIFRTFKTVRPEKSPPMDCTPCASNNVFQQSKHLQMIYISKPTLIWLSTQIRNIIATAPVNTILFFSSTKRLNLWILARS